MNSLDTNVILRFLLDDVPEQTRKIKPIVTGSAAYVTDVVMTEAVFVLERVIGINRRDILRLIKAFLGLPNLIYNDYFLDQVIDLYGGRSSLSFVDCYAAVEAKVYGNALVTFDKALLKHGGSRVKAP